MARRKWPYVESHPGSSHLNLGLLAVRRSLPTYSGTNPMLTRRDLLLRTAGGFGGLALAHLLATDTPGAAKPDLNGGLHHRAKARRVIQLFMNGGASQMDTFDYKPTLQRRHGQTFDPGNGQRVEAVTSVPGKILGCPHPFRQHGQSGR